MILIYSRPTTLICWRTPCFKYGSAGRCGMAGHAMTRECAEAREGLIGDCQYYRFVFRDHNAVFELSNN